MCDKSDGSCFCKPGFRGLGCNNPTNEAVGTCECGRAGHVNQRMPKPYLLSKLTSHGVASSLSGPLPALAMDAKFEPSFRELNGNL